MRHDYDGDEHLEHEDELAFPIQWGSIAWFVLKAAVILIASATVAGGIAGFFMGAR
jgi:hypothetical protein